MSRRKILHAKADRRVITGTTQQGRSFEIAVRGDAKEYRAKHGISPRGLRNESRKARRRKAGGK
jgi:hypothetical protein